MLAPAGNAQLHLMLTHFMGLGNDRVDELDVELDDEDETKVVEKAI